MINRYLLPIILLSRLVRSVSESTPALPILCYVLLSASVAQAVEAPIVILTDGRSEYDLRPHMAALPLATEAPIDEVISQPLSDAFQPAPELAPGIGSESSPIWVRFRVNNATASRSEWILEFPKHSGSLTLYFIDDSEQQVEIRSSGLTAYHDRLVKRRTIVFPLSLPPGETRIYHVRFEYRSNWVAVPLILWTPEAYTASDRDAQLVLGLYFGLLLVMTLYNAFLYVSLKDEAYLWYVLTTLLMALMAAAFHGSAHEYLWPSAAWGYVRPLHTLSGLASATLARFVQVFLRTRTQSPIGHKVLWLLTATSLLISVLGILGIPALGLFLTSGLASPIAIFTIAIIVWRKGYRPARFFLIAWAAFLLGYMLAFASGLRILPAYFLDTAHWLWIGNAMEVVLLSFALADRINILRREREEQEALAIEADRVNRETREQSERKSAFLASMAHELRTPLNAIKGFNNLVLRRAADVLPERQKDNLQKVDRASNHLLAMINDLLDLSKIEAGRMDVNATAVNVRQLVLSACDVVSPLIKEGVELQHEIAENIGEVNTDSQRLQQMLINLLSNAIKFTDQGSVTASANRVDDRLIIAVTDTGKGIPADAIDTLFDEYRQVRGQSESTVQKGTGLGLSITKRFAELLNGTIQVESEVGQGSTFTITVPSVYKETESGN